MGSQIPCEQLLRTAVERDADPVDPLPQPDHVGHSRAARAGGVALALGRGTGWGETVGASRGRAEKDRRRDEESRQAAHQTVTHTLERTPLRRRT